MSASPYTEDCVVWHVLSGPNIYKGVWWPCKVLPSENDCMVIESFGDNCEISIAGSQCSEKIRPFACEERDSYVAKGQKKFKGRKETLKEYLEAIQEAQDFYRENEDDPTFCINFDGSINNSSSFFSPKATPLSANTSIFTTGGCTTDTSPAPMSGRRSSSKKRPVPFDPLVEPRSSDNTRKRPRRSGMTTPRGGDKHPSTVVAKLNYDESEPLAVQSKTNGRKLRKNRRSKTPRDEGSDSQSSPDSDILTKGLEKRSFPRNKRESRVTNTSRSSERESRVTNASRSSQQSDVTRLPKKSAISSFDETRDTESDTRLPAVPANSVETETSKRLPTSPVPQGLRMEPESCETPGLDLMLKEIKEGAQGSDGENTYSESESDDSDLPVVDFTVKEDIRFHDLKENDVVWVKYNNFPFWPCIVSKVKVIKREKKKKKASVLSARKTKSNIYVKFLGYNDLDQSVKVTNHRNVAKFATKRAPEFEESGKGCPQRKYFEQGVEDARMLIRLRAGGSIKGTPDQQYKAVTNYRPITYKPEVGSSPMVMASLSGIGKSYKTESDTPTSAGGISTLDMSDSDEDIHISSSEGEEDNESYDYNRVKVMDIVNKIEPELMAIARGEAESTRHSIFVSGTSKEKEELKKEGAFGPLLKWKQTKRADFISHLQKMASKSQHQPLQCRITLNYILGVLLPEAMIKVIMSTEGLTYDKAQDKLNQM